MMSIRRRFLLSYATLIVLVLVYLAVSGGIGVMRRRTELDRTEILVLQNSWNSLQNSLNEMVVNWDDGDAFSDFSRDYKSFDTRLSEAGSVIERRIIYSPLLKRRIGNLREVWIMARSHLDLVIEHVEDPAFDDVETEASRVPGLQRLTHLWVGFYEGSTERDRRLAYQLESLILLVDSFPIYSETMNHLFDVILSDADAFHRRTARIETLVVGVFFLLFLAVTIFLSLRFSHALSRPIIRVSDRLNRFMGRHGPVGTATGQDEVRVLARTVEHMVRHYTKLADKAIRLAHGDVSEGTVSSSLNGVVGRSMEEISAYFHELAETSTRIRNGEYHARIAPKSKNDILALNINSMADVIQEQINTLRSIFEGIDEGILVVDTQLQVVEYNQRLLRLLGIEEPADGSVPDCVTEIPLRLEPLIVATLNGTPRSEHFSTLEGRTGQTIPVRLNVRKLEPVDQEEATVLFLVTNESWRERAKRERERLRAHATEAELRALRAQINPHFFFNSLNTIAYLVETNVENAVETIERLASLFRYTLASTRKSRVALQEELEQIKRYLAIEKFRYEDRLNVRFDVEYGVEHVRIPPMLLQPIVENAVRYGQDEKGKIDLVMSVARENDALAIGVSDRGVGLVDQKSLMQGPGIGLQNVNHRLKTLYREQLSFHYRQPHGLTVGLRIPVL